MSKLGRSIRTAQPAFTQSFGVPTRSTYLFSSQPSIYFSQSRSKSSRSSKPSAAAYLDNSSRPHMGFKIVPHEHAYIVERFGKFRKILEPGLHFLIPFVDKIHYSHNLMAQMIKVDPQQCWTKDNVLVEIDGNVFVKVLDAYQASYSARTPYSMIFESAMAEMRTIVGNLNLDELMSKREEINEQIAAKIRPQTLPWGLEATKYEVRGIHPQKEVSQDMSRQSKAERARREAVKKSMGDREVKINIAEGEKVAKLLESEAQQLAAINIAKGEAKAQILRAEAEAQSQQIKAEGQAQALRMIGAALEEAPEAARLDIAKEVVTGWQNMAEKSNTLILPEDPSNITNMIGKAFSAYQILSNQQYDQKLMEELKEQDEPIEHPEKKYIADPM